MTQAAQCGPRSMNNYQLGLLEPGGLDRAARLRQRVFGGSPELNRAYLRWKYLENPYLSEPLLYVAQKQGEIVGMRGWFGTSWLIPGIEGPKTIPCAAESAIATDHRDRGLYAGLTEFAFADLRSRGFPLVLNMSASPANYVTSLMTMGWKSVGSYESLVFSREADERKSPADFLRGSGLGTRLERRVTASGELGKLMRRVNHLGRYLIDRIGTSSGSGISSAGGSIRVMDQPPFAVLSSIADAFHDRQRISHVRDDSYFRWRYRNPLGSYQIVFPAGDDPDVFLCFHREDGPVLRLIDWAGDEARVLALLEEVIAECMPRRVFTWGATLSTRMREHLDQFGFEPDTDSRRSGLLIRGLGPDPHDYSPGGLCLLDMPNWNLRMVFSDRH